MAAVGSSSSIVPASVFEAVRKTSENLKELEADFLQFLSLCEPDVLSEMAPLQRAQSLFLLSKAATNLVALRLRCSGVNPEDHPLKSEIDRVNLYHDKIERAIDLSKAPVRPSATLNYKAATRFIDHALPNLTPAQKQSMREISRGERPKTNSFQSTLHRKRKHPSEKQSVRAAAQEFLEKASRELLGEKIGFKGPLRVEEDDAVRVPSDDSD